MVHRPGCVFRQLDLILCHIRALAGVRRLLHLSRKIRRVVDEILEVRLGTETTAVRGDMPIPVEREHLFEPLFEVRQVESWHALEEDTLDWNPVDREDDP